MIRKALFCINLCLLSACSTCSSSVVPSSVCGILEFGFDNWFLDDLRQRNVDGMKGGGVDGVHLESNKSGVDCYLCFYFLSVANQIIFEIIEHRT